MILPMDSTSGRLEELKLLWETDPTAKVYLQLADEYRRLGQTAEAIQVLEKTLAQRPRDPRGRVALARCRMDLGEIGEAIRLLEEVIKLDPAHAVASKLLLECHLQARDTEKAAERFNIYRLLNDRDPELDHLEFRLRRLQEHPEDGDAPPVAPEAAAPPLAAAADEEPFAPSVLDSHSFAIPRIAAEPPAADSPLDARVAALEASFGVHHSAPPAPAAVAASAAPQDDPFGNLLQPVTVPTVDLFSFLKTPSAVPEAAAAPSFDQLWGLPPAAAPPVAAPPVAEPPTVPAAPVAPTLAAPVPPPAFSTGDPFAELLPPAPAAAASADPFADFFAAPPSPPPALEVAWPVFQPVPAAPVLGPAFESAPAPEPEPEDEPMGATATLGELYLKQGHLAEAEQIFYQVLEREPGNSVALTGLARLVELREPAPPAYEPEPLYEMEPAYEPEPAAPEPPPVLEAPFVPEPSATWPTYHPEPLHEAEPVYQPEPAESVYQPELAAPEPAAPEPAYQPAIAPRRLDAAFLLAERSFGDAVPAGLTAKKMLILRRYLEHLRPTRATDVQ